MESHDPAALTDRERSYPDWNEAVLAERQAIVGMTENLEEKLSIASRVKQLVRRRPAERETAEHEGAGVKGELLVAVFALFPDEFDGFDLFQPAPADAETGRRWRQGLIRAVSQITRGRRWLNCAERFHGPRISSGKNKTPSSQQDQFGTRMYLTGKQPRKKPSGPPKGYLTNSIVLESVLGRRKPCRTNRINAARGCIRSVNGLAKTGQCSKSVPKGYLIEVKGALLRAKADSRN